jgi:hypothetical protein
MADYSGETPQYTCSDFMDYLATPDKIAPFSNDMQMNLRSENLFGRDWGMALSCNKILVSY